MLAIPVQIRQWNCKRTRVIHSFPYNIMMNNLAKENKSKVKILKAVKRFGLKCSSKLFHNLAVPNLCNGIYYIACGNSIYYAQNFNELLLQKKSKVHWIILYSSEKQGAWHISAYDLCSRCVYLICAKITEKRNMSFEIFKSIEPICLEKIFKSHTSVTRIAF